MLSHVYMYKKLLMCKKILNALEDKSEDEKVSRDGTLKMSDLFDLIWIQQINYQTAIL